MTVYIACSQSYSDDPVRKCTCATKEIAQRILSEWQDADPLGWFWILEEKVVMS